MYNLLRTKALKDAIQDVIDGVTITQSSSYDFKEAVIDNAGGIIPSYLWEYHTREQAKRTGVLVENPFLYQNAVYGFYRGGLLLNLWEHQYIPSLLTSNLYQEVGGMLRRYENGYRDFNLQGAAQSSQVTLGYTSYFSEDGEAIETPLERGFYKFKNFLLPEGLLNNFNLQVLDSGYFMSIYDSCFMLDSDFQIYRGVRLDEPYSYSRAEYNMALRMGYGAQANDGRNIPFYTQYPVGKSFYTSPYIYFVADDRVVRYVVD